MHNLVFQVYDDALGGSQTDSFYGFEYFLVAAGDNVAEFGWCERRQNHSCRVCSYSRHADEQAVESSFLFGCEAVERVAVVASAGHQSFVHEQFYLLFSLDCAVCVERNVECIAHSACVDNR